MRGGDLAPWKRCSHPKSNANVEFFRLENSLTHTSNGRYVSSLRICGFPAWQSNHGDDAAIVSKLV
jgi:hypothetical protein